MDGQQLPAEITVALTADDITAGVICIRDANDDITKAMMSLQTLQTTDAAKKALTDYYNKRLFHNNSLLHKLSKALMFVVVLLSVCMANAQTFTTIGAGAAAPGGLTGELSVGYKYAAWQVQAGFHSIVRADEPVLFYTKAGYYYALPNNFSLQVMGGYCRYMQSTDDKRKNSNSYIVTVSAQSWVPGVEDGSVYVAVTAAKQHVLFSAGFVYWFNTHTVRRVGL